ncbi:MAG: tRNA glutamyl-Q(34) synthetase GluQRS [Candidatus Thiosymbion ectosymbiont of Robbea hypermnestra]|nr:tRNA glutamyl-Q(34) synthetase GluQRS [Candidatus Thiosymbion ectosymbiont of Robbea hypermnestra]
MARPAAPGDETTAAKAVYCGRFAPSPTGPLHFGSLIAALGSYLDARVAGGKWLVRMEDLDRPREVPGAADAILRTLETCGFQWDGQVLRQSTRTRAYAQAIERLSEAGLVFPCACSRREIAASGRPGVDGPIYPGTCRRRPPPGTGARSLRLRTEQGNLLVRDRIQGELHQDLAREVGDFVLRRADGIHAYQLAVVVDDGFQGINQVVRGADLLTSTPRQLYLFRALRLLVPTYAHLPLVVDGAGRKLGKSHAAAPVDPDAPLPTLLRAWDFLGQKPFPEPPADLAEFWTQARSAWRMDRVPSRPSRSLPTG